MRSKVLVVLAGLALLPLTAVADPGDLDTTFGDEGWVQLEAVSSNVGVVGLRVHEGSALVSVATDPQSGFAVLVTGEGTQATTIPFPGPGLATFDHLGRIVAAVNVDDGVRLIRFDSSGMPDEGFGVDGRAEVAIPGAVWGDLLADASGVVVAGGVLGPEQPPWVARFDHFGEPDPAFGESGVSTLDAIESAGADLLLPNGLHVAADGYLVIIRVSAVAGDTVVQAVVDRSGNLLGHGGTGPIEDLFAVESTTQADGRVLLVIQTTEDDVDTFAMYHHPAPPPRGPAPPLVTFEDDEVGGPVRLAPLRTGEVVVGYNVGPDASFRLRIRDSERRDVDDLIPPDLSDLWMYGIASSFHDGGLYLLVDETPSNSIEPDDLSLVKVFGDESGRFIDDDGSAHESDIEELAAQRITLGCNPPDNYRYCPDDPVTRGQMAAFLVRALELPAAPGDAFVDDDGSVFEDDINRLAAAGITRGCDPPANTMYCPGQSVTRGQMAALLVRALELPAAPGDTFVDDDGSVFEDDINRLAAAGITRGCDPPANSRFCPNQPVTRGQMATLLIRGLNQP